MTYSLRNWLTLLVRSTNVAFLWLHNLLSFNTVSSYILPPRRSTAVHQLGPVLLRLRNSVRFFTVIQPLYKADWVTPLFLIIHYVNHNNSWIAVLAPLFSKTVLYWFTIIWISITNLGRTHWPLNARFAYRFKIFRYSHTKQTFLSNHLAAH